MCSRWNCEDKCFRPALDNLPAKAKRLFSFSTPINTCRLAKAVARHSYGQRRRHKHGCAQTRKHAAHFQPQVHRWASVAALSIIHLSLQAPKIRGASFRGDCIYHTPTTSRTTSRTTTCPPQSEQRAAQPHLRQPQKQTCSKNRLAKWRSLTMLPICISHAVHPPRCHPDLLTHVWSCNASLNHLQNLTGYCVWRQTLDLSR